MSQDDRHAETGSTVAVPGQLTWMSRVERGMEQLLHISHVASPDEVPGMVATAAALFNGDDALICLADLQQRVLVPFRAPSSHTHDESAQVLGVDSTIAGRAFQQMQRLTFALGARARWRWPRRCSGLCCRR